MRFFLTIEQLEARRGSSRVFLPAIFPVGGADCKSCALRAEYGEFLRSRWICGRARESYPAECCSQSNLRGERSKRVVCGVRPRKAQRQNGGREGAFGRPRHRGRSARRRGWEFCLRGWRASFGSRRRQRFCYLAALTGSLAGKEGRTRDRHSRS